MSDFYEREAAKAVSKWSYRARSSGLDQFAQEWFSRHEAMGADPELVKITSPLQAPSVAPACSSKEDKR